MAKENSAYKAPARKIELAEKDGSLEIPRKVQLLRTGTYQHPDHGKLAITPEMLATMKKNFDEKVRGIDLMFDYAHESDQVAAGWFKNITLENGGTELWAEVDWTPAGQKVLADKEFRYTSADFTTNYRDNETGKEYGPTLFGAGLTNRPFIKRMSPAVELSETSKGDDMDKDLQIKELTAKLSDAEAKVKKLEEGAPNAEQLKAKIAELEQALKAAQDQLASMQASAAKVEEEKKLAEKKGRFDKMLSEGKAVEAQREPFMKGDMDKFIELAQPLNPGKGHGGSGNGGGDSYQLNEQEKEICKRMGLTEEEYKKANGLK